MPAVDGQLTAGELIILASLIKAQADARAQLTATAVAAATLPLKAFNLWWDSKAIDSYIRDVLRVVRPAQIRMARTTDAYIARTLSTMTGRRVNPIGAVNTDNLRRAITAQMAEQIVAALPAGYDFAPSQPPPARTLPALPGGAAATTVPPASAGADTIVRPVAVQPVATANPAAASTTRRASGTTTAASSRATLNPEDVYARIFDSARFHIISRGLDEEQVRAKSIARAASVAATDIMLADRAQARATMRTRGVQTYRRVLRPYAGSGGPVCGLCIVASTRIYYIEDLLPIHANCRCTVVPVGSHADPGDVFNREDLRALYAAAGSTGGGKLQGGALKKVRVQITEHGELGPVLVNADHHRRGPGEVAAATSSDPDTTARAQLASYEDVALPRLLAREAAGEDVTKALSWQVDKIAELRRRLGLPGTDPAGGGGE